MNPRAASSEAWTEERYLEMERASVTRHEFFAGRIYATAGASPEHNAIVGNLMRELGVAARPRRCFVYPPDMRLWVEAAGLYTYPDVSVACAPAFRNQDSLVNPQLLVEVLSDSTESYDRGTKCEWYRTVPSVAEILLVSQKKPLVEQYTRQHDGSWVLHERRSREQVILAPLECAIAVDEIYLGVEWKAPEPV